MNAARKRRILIRKKAEKMRQKHFKARLNELIREVREEFKKRQNKPETRPALVYLKVDWGTETDYITGAIVDLPIKNPTETLRSMQKNGFWVPRPNNQMLYVPPGMILQVKWDMNR